MGIGNRAAGRADLGAEGLMLMKNTLGLRTYVAAAGAVALLLGTAACSSGDSSDGSGDASQSAAPAVQKDDAIAALVPAEVASDGVLTIGTDASYAPSEFIDTDGETIIGFDPDLATALGEVLGLQVEMQNAPFDSLVEGVKTGKYELSFSSFTINPDRLEQVDMVSYFNAGTQWAVASGNPAGIDPDQACGKRIAVQKATVQAEDIAARNQTCIDGGQEAIRIEEYQLQSDVTNAVATGKNDAMLADSPVIAYAVQQTGDKLETLGDIYDSAPYGVAVPKDQGDLAQAVQQGMQKLIDSGAYLTILKQWNVQQGAIETAEINPAPAS
jgi:polar amino acid transport system substrate-binding protein